MSDPSDIPFIIEVGVPGPAGSGAPTTSEWNSYKATVDALMTAPNNIQTVSKIRRTGSGQYTHAGAATPLGDPIWDIARVDGAKYYEVLMFGSAEVDVAAGKQAYTRFYIDIAGVNHFIGDFDTASPGTAYPVSFSAGFRAPPSLPGFIQVRVVISTLDATPATWKNVRIWGSCRQVG